MKMKTAAQRLGARLDDDPIKILGAFGDAESFYEISLYGKKLRRPEIDLMVTWRGTRALEALVAASSSLMREAAARNEFPVVYRSKHPSFGLALKRFAKCVRTGELSELSGALRPHFGSIEASDGESFEDAILAFAETFDAEVPEARALDSLRAEWNTIRATSAGIEAALDEARAEQKTATERAERERADARKRELEEALLFRKGEHLTVDTSKTPLRGERSQLDREHVKAMLAAHDDATKLLIMGDHVGPWLGALIALKPQALKMLVIDTFWEPLTRSTQVNVSDISETLAACANLERAFIVGGSVLLQPLEHPRLEDLTLVADPYEGWCAEHLFGSRAPALLRLALGLRYERRSIADEAIIGALRNDALVALEELTIAHARKQSEILQAIAESGLLARLKVLRMPNRDEAQVDACAAYVDEHHEAFAHLAELGLGTDAMPVSPEIRDSLKARVPGLTFCDDPFEPGAYNRTAFVEQTSPWR